MQHLAALVFQVHDVASGHAIPAMIYVSFGSLHVCTTPKLYLLHTKSGAVGSAVCDPTQRFVIGIPGLLSTLVPHADWHATGSLFALISAVSTG